jgi:hypothetical protein
MPNWSPRGLRVRGIEIVPPREGYAVCRRYPPTVNPSTIGGLSGFPTVHPTDTGEWQQAPGA